MVAITHPSQFSELNGTLPSDSIVEIDGLTRRFGSKLALDGVDFRVPKGSVVGLVGENGAGKTTLVKLLSKLYEPTSGRILVDGAELARMPADQWRERLAGA
jgi:ATP-binding cassette subfamily B protein